MIPENKYKVKDEALFAEVQKLKDGTSGDYNLLYELSEKYIYKIINDIVKNHHTTEDLMQETYLQIYNKIDTLQEAKTFYVWAGRIATNLTLRHVQKYRKETLAVADEEGSTDFVFDVATDDNECFIPENVLMDKEKQRLIAEIIDNLSIEQKLSVQYFYYEEMSVKDIAQVMGCSEGTVKSRLNYARKSIKDAVIDLDVKQGTRLYSLGTLPLFWLVFRESVEAFVIAGATAAAGVAGSVAGAVGGTSSVGTAGAVAGSVGSAGTGMAGTVAGGAGSAGTGGGIASTVASVGNAGVTSVTGGAVGGSAGAVGTAGGASAAGTAGATASTGASVAAGSAASTATTAGSAATTGTVASTGATAGSAATAGAASGSAGVVGTAGGASAAGTTGATASAGAATAGTAASTGATAGSAASTGAATGATKVATGLGAKFFGTAAGKAVAGITAAAVFIGGGAAIANQMKEPAVEQQCQGTITLHYWGDATKEDVWQGYEEWIGLSLLDEDGNTIISENIDFRDSDVQDFYNYIQDNVSVPLEEVQSFFDQYQQEAIEAIGNDENWYIDVTEDMEFPDTLEFTYDGVEIKFDISRVSAMIDIRNYGTSHSEEDFSTAGVKKVIDGEEYFYCANGVWYSIHGTYTCEGDISQSKYAQDQNGNNRNEQQENAEQQSEGQITFYYIGDPEKEDIWEGHREDILFSLRDKNGNCIISESMDATSAEMQDLYAIMQASTSLEDAKLIFEEYQQEAAEAESKGENWYLRVTDDLDIPDTLEFTFDGIDITFDIRVVNAEIGFHGYHGKYFEDVAYSAGYAEGEGEDISYYYASRVGYYIIGTYTYEGDITQSKYARDKDLEYIHGNPWSPTVWEEEVPEQPTPTPEPTEAPLTEEEKAELELKQQLEAGIDELVPMIEEKILSYYDAVQNNPVENGSEYLMSDIYYDIYILNALIEEYDMHYYVDDRFSISGYEDENGAIYVSYIFEPEGCEGNNRLGFYYTDDSFLGGGGRGKASRIGQVQWRYGVYYGAYDGDVRTGQGTLYGYKHTDYDSEGFYAYSGEWVNDVPNGSGNWEMQIHVYNDRLEWYQETAEVVAVDGRLTGSFNVDISDENGNNVKGIYNMENNEYTAVGTNTYVLEKPLKKDMGPDDYAYCVCYNNEGHGSLVLWRHYDEREPGDHWVFRCNYDRDFDN